MSKRMTDTGKWEKRWFRELPTAYKLFWQFLLDRCDLAGFWDVDFKAATFFIGSKIDREKAKILLKDQIYEIIDKETNQVKYWFIIDFIKFQNGWPLNPSSPVHKKIIDLLNSKGIEIKEDTLWDRVYDRVCHTPLVIVRVDKGGMGENEKLEPLNDLGWTNDEPLYRGLLKNFPKLFKFKKPLTYDQHNNLIEKYGTAPVKQIYMEMENYATLLKKSDSANLTAQNWLNRKKNDTGGK